ncbi:uncharacterized protein UV8b_06289 [Ustilaginoidea virens]|uniref:Mis12 domain-containing protein n=1 Tax=Ustilaginoidea virens TaxID=1159556 RepID=A0A8E5HV07_USTVR|nr:uncharacterized protein UV8b_06289 [Ustilaginoidea virens]QUC22048.1 hypothetical protein UV8b_06289 [Ustilaginoidea virens]
MATTPPAVSDYELLTEHFGYSPVALLDDIINTVNVLADRALDSVERLLLSIPPSNLGFKPPKTSGGDDDDDAAAAAASAAAAAARHEIEHGTHQLETLLNAAIDKNFDIFELYTMQNILTVKAADEPFIRLSHYDGLDLSAQPALDKVADLRGRLRASQKLHVALEAERARNDALLGRLKAALLARAGDDEEPGAGGAQHAGPLAFLRDSGSLAQGGADAPITTTAEFALSQLQPLRELSSALRTLLPELAAETDPQADHGSWRRQRSEYVESATRKYLERTGGLDLGPSGEVRDGEWQGGGPSLTRSDVESLEKAASMLQSSTAKGPGPQGPADDGEQGRASTTP